MFNKINMKFQSCRFSVIRDEGLLGLNSSFRSVWSQAVFVIRGGRFCGAWFFVLCFFVLRNPLRFVGMTLSESALILTFKNFKPCL